MGLFDSLFKSKKSSVKEEKSIPWKALSSLPQLEEIDAQSKTQPVVIFKHSTRCGISRMVLNRFNDTYALPADKLNLYLLDLLSNRAVSNEIAARYGIVHQSPQMIVIQDGKAVFSTTHQAIEATDLEKFI